MSGVKYFALLVILFLNLVVVLKQGLRVNYLGELLVFIMFLIASLIILISLHKEKDYGIFTALFFLISLLNMFYIRNSFHDSQKINMGLLGILLFGFAFLLNTVGFLIGAFSIEKKITEKQKEKIIEEVIEPKIKAAEEKLKEFAQKESPKEAKVEPWPSVTEAFYPGKYVASKNGSVYHAPKCDWAKKISVSRRVWFKSDEEARKKGYKKHSCLKK